MARTDLPQLRAAFDQELAERVWLTMDLVRATATDELKPLDRTTVGDAIRGQRWPDRRSRARIERALGWDPGWMQRIRDGVPLDTLKAARGDSVAVLRLRDPASHSLAEATDAEIEAEVQRRRVTGQ